MFLPGVLEDTIIVRYRNFVNTCLTDTTFSIFQKLMPQIPATGSKVLCQNAGLFTLPYENQNVIWSGTGVVSQKKFNPARSSGQYTLNGLAINGFCRANTKLFVTVRDSTLSICAATQVSNELSSEKPEIFPNPAEDRLFLKMGYGLHSIQVFDGLGREIKESTDLKKSGNSMYELKISSWKTGLYLIRTQTNKGTFVQKIVKK
jgi:hypothetical protein